MPRRRYRSKQLFSKECPPAMLATPPHRHQLCPADASKPPSPGVQHVERLGRELKCPICLNLFKQAATLSCNHSFCTSCILESMKATPACPICKVPTTRREVRAAPQMDSLVVIYKGMENAVGINSFASKLLTVDTTGDLNQKEGEECIVDANVAGSSPTPPNKRCKHRQPLSDLTNDVKGVHNRRQNPLLKGVIPVKKRVHVPSFTSISGELCLDHGKEQPSVDFTGKYNGCTKIQDQDSQLTETKTSLQPTFSGLKDTDDLMDELKQMNEKLLADLQKEQATGVKETHARKGLGEVSDIDGHYQVHMPAKATNSIVSKPRKKGNTKLNGKSFILTGDSGRISDRSRNSKSDRVEKPLEQGIPRLDFRFVQNQQQSFHLRSKETDPLNIATRIFHTKSATEETSLSADAIFEAILGSSPDPVQTNQNVGQSNSSKLLDGKGAGTQGLTPVCAFCLTSGTSELAGPMMHYKDGIPVDDKTDSLEKLLHVHKLCAEWAPNVYFVDCVAQNLEAEVARGKKIKCSSCGLKGAALGCCLRHCRKSYHYPCARAISCRWDDNHFVTLCPEHTTCKFPHEGHKHPGVARTALSVSDVGNVPNVDPALRLTTANDSETWAPCQSCKWVLCGSGLNSVVKERLASFAKLTGATMVKVWTSSVTHIIAGTDDQGAARRTLKFLLGTLEGKWIVNVDWMRACIQAGKPVDEEAFEIRFDIHGMVDGPKRGRSLAASKAPKLFEGIDFYLVGEYVPSYRADLQTLVVAAGGNLLHRKPLELRGQGIVGQKQTIIIYSKDIAASHGNIADYSSEIEMRFREAKLLAESVGAGVVSHLWIMDSIAASKLQPLEYTGLKSFV